MFFGERGERRLPEFEVAPERFSQTQQHVGVPCLEGNLSEALLERLARLYYPWCFGGFQQGTVIECGRLPEVTTLQQCLDAEEVGFALNIEA